MAIDALDRQILATLVNDGRLSHVQLAERIPLSPTAIARRIRQLEDDGLIEGYSARLSRHALDLSLAAIIHVSLKSQNAEMFLAFEKAIVETPSVVSCHLTTGEDDYVLTVLARDLNDFERIYREQLMGLPGVNRLRSSLALREIVDRRLPADALKP